MMLGAEESLRLLELVVAPQGPSPAVRVPYGGFRARGPGARWRLHHEVAEYPDASSIDPGLPLPGHLWIDETKLELNPDVPVTAKTPPTFIVQPENDDVDNINHSLVYYLALKKAGVPVEMHLYAQGGHAFGLRRTQHPDHHLARARRDLALHTGHDREVTLRDLALKLPVARRAITRMSSPVGSVYHQVPFDRLSKS